jgi:glycosyltransferase involved in cell wall biosynthesis
LLARESFWLYKAKEAVTAYGTSDPPINAIELNNTFLAEYPELVGKRIFLFLSRIQEKKGCDLLVAAFAAVANRDERLHLVMAGPDQAGWVSALKQQAEQLGIGHKITWTGMLQGDRKWGAFYSSEVFCLPSHQENFGIVVAEALACGKPVLISNKVNIWREIESDVAGFVDQDTVDGTISNLVRWLALSPSEAKVMSLSATRCFNSRFRIERAAMRLIEIIEGNL